MTEDLDIQMIEKNNTVDKALHSSMYSFVPHIWSSGPHQECF